MMKHEYEKISKIEVTPEEYKLIEGLYMNSNLDKFEFSRKVANKDFVLGLRAIKVKELEGKLARIEQYATNMKAQADASYGNEQSKELEKPVLEAFPHDKHLYAYNKRLMGLAVTVEMANLLDILAGKR